jgi:predicted secreted protein
VSLSSSDTGKSVRLKVGERLHIALGSTYWTFRGSDAPRVLRQDGSGVAKPTTTCSGPVGSGCGARTADFTAVGKGHTSVVATRTTCGEAMRCVGANGRFVVYVTVG